MSDSEITSPLSPAEPRASRYWLALSTLFGLALEVAALADRAWLWLFVPVFALALYILARLFGQVEAWIRGRSMPGWLSALIFVFGLAAFQLRGNAMTPWLGTGLSVLGFAVILTLLNRYGKFQERSRPTSEPTA